MGSDVFISYSTENRIEAEAILDAVEAKGHACWIAPRNIVAGASWADAIIEAISGARLVILVHSHAANASPMVRRELDAAAAARKLILPVRIDDAMPERGMKFYLANCHWFDAPPPLAARLHALAGATGTLLGRASVEPGAPRPSPQGRILGFGDNLAVAVMPFRTFAEADVPFADGLTDELINALSRWRSFPVIARDSVFALRQGGADIRTLGRELGVANTITGSVRRYQARVRVNLDLTDAETSRNLMSEGYECTADDPLRLQDELVRGIAGVLAPEVLKIEAERASRRTDSETSAYVLFEKGMWHRYRRTREDLESAAGMFRAALEVEPRYARAMAALSLCHNFAATNRWVPDVRGAYAEALALALHAVAEDPRDPHAHFALGVGCMNDRRLTKALAELAEAIRLNPSHAYAHANLGHCYNYLNRPDEAFPEIELALRLNPHDPKRFMWLPYLAASHYLSGRYKECLAAAEQALAANPTFPLALRYLVAALGQLGRVAEAAAVLPLVRRVDRDFDGLEATLRRLFVPAAAGHILDGMRRAGFS